MSSSSAPSSRAKLGGRTGRALLHLDALHLVLGLGRGPLGTLAGGGRRRRDLLGLVDPPPGLNQLVLELPDALLRGRQVAERLARAVAVALAVSEPVLELKSLCALGLRALLGRPPRGLEAGHRRPQPRDVRASCPELPLESVNLGAQVARGLLGLGRAPADGLGLELGAGQRPRRWLVGLGDHLAVGLWTLRQRSLTGLDLRLVARGTERLDGCGQRHHDGTELQPSSAAEVGGQGRRHREADSPHSRRGTAEAGRLGHRREPVTAPRRLDHQRRLGTPRGAPATPATRHSDGQVLAPLGEPLDDLDAERRRDSRRVVHRLDGNCSGGRTGARASSAVSVAGIP